MGGGGGGVGGVEGCGTQSIGGWRSDGPHTLSIKGRRGRVTGWGQSASEAKQEETWPESQRGKRKVEADGKKEWGEFVGGQPIR